MHSHSHFVAEKRPFLQPFGGALQAADASSMDFGDGKSSSRMEKKKEARRGSDFFNMLREVRI